MDRCSLSKKPHGTRGLGSFRGKSRQRQGQLLPVWHPHQALLPPPNLIRGSAISLLVGMGSPKWANHCHPSTQPEPRSD
eukprot:scaffold135665_cov17-Tisochrysis_lutea.AAC.1